MARVQTQLKPIKSLLNMDLDHSQLMGMISSLLLQRMKSFLNG